MNLKKLYRIADYKDSQGMLFNNDCLEIMSDIPKNSIDMVLCDLPYGVTAQNKWDIIIPFDKLWEQYNRIVKPNGAIVLNCQEPFSTMLISSNIKNFKYKWYWSKKQVSNFLNAKKQPLRNIEEIAVFYRKQCIYNPQMRKGKLQLKNTGGKSSNYNEFKAQPHVSDEYYPTTLIEVPLPRFKNGHPTQKPIELCEYMIKTYTNEGEIVLDNTMGSGTTCLAAKNTNRRYIGIEKELKYFNMAVDRMKNKE